MADSVDHKARVMAQRASDKIDSHEQFCGERWAEARDQMKTVGNRIWWLIGLVLVGQGTVIVVFARALFK